MSRPFTPNVYIEYPEGHIGIVLGCGKIALIDKRDLASAQHRRWYWDVSADARGYVRATAKKNYPNIRLHQLVAKNAKWDGEILDHIFGDTLDNRRKFIRPATHAQNLYNSRKQKGECTSRFKGVYQSNETTWRATIRADGVKRDLGGFATERLAAIARDREAMKLHGAFAKLNFPELWPTFPIQLSALRLRVPE